MSDLTANKNSLISYGIPFLIIILVLMPTLELSAQEPPPRPVEVSVFQNLGFGAFTPGVIGGTVIISPNGSRSSTGDILLLNLGYLYFAATYRLVANPGTVISIVNGPDVVLTGGGGSMNLHIGISDPVSPFVITTIPSNYTELRVGGTLTVGNASANPPGSYSGTFDIMLIQE